MKLAEIVQNTFLNILKAILVVSGIILSSKTPGSDIKDMESLDGLFAWQNLMKLSKTVQNAFLNIFKTIFLNQCETGKKIFKTILVVSGIIYTDFHSKIITTLGARQMGSTTLISNFFS